ncbi:MAG: hypothetical protein WBC69_19205 [Geitlerinemataceae cyanobacterium]
MSIIPYEQFNSGDGIEVVIEHATQAAYFTISGYARMVGLSKQAISKRCGTVNQNDLKTAETPTATGLKRSTLIPAKLAFKWAIKDNPDLAERMGECGATVFAYQLAGYQLSAQSEPKRAITWYTDRVMDLRNNLTVPAGYWCCIQECGHLLLEVERMGYQVNQFDLLDGSIGTRWANYRIGNPWTQPSTKASYKMPRKAFPVKINAYELSEIVEFKKWLPSYERNNLMGYLEGKYGAIAKVN